MPCAHYPRPVPRDIWAPSDPATKWSPCARREGTPSPLTPRGHLPGGLCVHLELRARQEAAGGGGVREGTGLTPLPAKCLLCSHSAEGVTARLRSLGSRLRPACGQPSRAQASSLSVPRSVLLTSLCLSPSLSLSLSLRPSPVSPAARPGEHRQAGAGVLVTQARTSSDRQPYHGQRSVCLLRVCPASCPQASGT